MPLQTQSDLSRPGSTSDSWGRYYTADWVSQHLVGAIETRSPGLVVELGAGEGSLSAAAASKWQNARFVTVDADHASKTHLQKFGQHKVHTHHVHDVLDHMLADRIGVGLGTVDVGICNPPYVRPRWKAGFGRILEEAGLSGALQSIHDAGADLLFIAQNLRLLRRDGKLGLILPDGLITAEKFSGVRSLLLRDHTVERVVQLPRGVFLKTEAQAFLVILSKHAGETQTVTLQQLRSDGQMSDPVAIPADLARKRLDYSYHFLNRSTRGTLRRGPTIRSQAASLVRGGVSSNEITNFRWPVFHLGDFASLQKHAGTPTVPAKFNLTTRAAATLRGVTRLAEPGNILVARIGRNLEEKIAVVGDQPCIISDCIFVLDIYLERRAAVLSYLLSPGGKAELRAVSHGVAAKYITRSDLLDLFIAD